MSDDLVKQLRGRSQFCKDRGEIKSPELMEEAAARIEELEAKLSEAVERVTSLRGVLHKICDPNLICLPKDITTALNDTNTTLTELTGGKDE